MRHIDLGRNEGVYSHLNVLITELTSKSFACHYDDVIMSAIASQITSLTIVYSIAYSDADQRKHQSSASLAFVRGIHRGPVNSPHKRPVTRKMFPFDDVIMCEMWGMLSKDISSINDDIMGWTRCPYYWPFVRGTTRRILYKWPVTRTFVVSLQIAWTRCWTNSRFY